MRYLFFLFLLLCINSLIILNPIVDQDALTDKLFNFTIILDDVFNSTDGESLDYFINNANDESLPSWMNIQTIYSPMKLSSTYSTCATAVEIYVKNNIAYVIDMYNGLEIINVSNPSNLSLLTTYDTPGSAYGIYVENNIAYVADYTYGLQIINVSNPSAPSLLSNYDTPGIAEGIYVDNNIAYVADQIGLQIINVSNPSAPSLLSTYYTPGYEKKYM